MTFGMELNTFLHSAAHVLNNPSDTEGYKITNENYTSAVQYIIEYMTQAMNRPPLDESQNNNNFKFFWKSSGVNTINLKVQNQIITMLTQSVLCQKLTILLVANSLMVVKSFRGKT